MFSQNVIYGIVLECLLQSIAGSDEIVVKLNFDDENKTIMASKL